MSEFRINSGILQNDLSSLYIAKESLYIIKAEIAWQILKLKVVSDDSAVSRIKGNLALYSKKLGNEVSNINYIINSGNTVISKAKTAEASANLTMSGLLSIISITWPFNGSSYISNAVAAGKSAVASFGDMLEQGMYELKDVVTGTAEALFWTGETLVELKNDAKNLLNDIITDSVPDVYNKLKSGNGIFDEETWSSVPDSFFSHFSYDVSDNSLLYIMQLGTLVGIDNSTVESHLENNKKVWEGGLEDDVTDNEGYIEKQGLMEKLKYGKHNSLYEKLTGYNKWSSCQTEGQDPTCDFNSCEVIAAYDILNYYEGNNKKYTFPELLSEFESSSTVASGYAGTAPAEVCNFLKGEGYKAKMYEGDNLSSSDYTSISGKYDSFIVTVYNDKNDLNSAVHTMAITTNIDSNGDTIYTIHNESGSSRYGYSLEEVIFNYNATSNNPVHGNDYDVVSIIGVSDE